MKNNRSNSMAVFLRNLARDMDTASCEMARLPNPWQVNSCKMRGQASLIREWASQIEHENRLSDDPDEMDKEALGLK